MVSLEAFLVRSDCHKQKQNGTKNDQMIGNVETLFSVCIRMVKGRGLE